MDSLQLSLLLLGAIVIGGVYAFNWLQERSLRKRAEQALDQPTEDVLMRAKREPVVPLPQGMPTRSAGGPGPFLPSENLPELLPDPPQEVFDAPLRPLVESDPVLPSGAVLPSAPTSPSPSSPAPALPPLAPPPESAVPPIPPPVAPLPETPLPRDTVGLLQARLARDAAAAKAQTGGPKPDLPPVVKPQTAASDAVPPPVVKPQSAAPWMQTPPVKPQTPAARVESPPVVKPQPESPRMPPASVPDAVPLPDARHAEPPLIERPSVAPAGLVIDYLAEFVANRPLPQSAVDDLHATIGSASRPARLFGFDERAGEWSVIGEGASGRWSRVRAALQFADRQGMASTADLENFGLRMEAAAERIGIALTLPAPGPFLEKARALDAFCGEVDIAIGISVVANPGTRFAGTAIRALAEAAGLRLEIDGLFHLRNHDGGDQFTLDNQDQEPFFAESLRSMSTGGVTFLLDVPRAQGGISAFDRMVENARRFAHSLGGSLVDDNRQVLNDAGLQATRRALSGVYATMEAQGVVPGSPTALRLFS